MIIPPGIGKHIVGKKGKIIRDMQMRHKVEILTASQRDNDETQITNTGLSKQNTKVIEDITKIITKQLDEQAKTTPKKEDHEGNICRYHKEGNCYYGDKCWRVHMPRYRPYNPEKHNNTPRSRSPHRTQYTKPQSPTRHQEARPRSRRQQRIPKTPQQSRSLNITPKKTSQQTSPSQITATKITQQTSPIQITPAEIPEKKRNPEPQRQPQTNRNENDSRRTNNYRSHHSEYRMSTRK